MKLRIIPMFAGVCLTIASSTHAASILRITEVMSDGDVGDWFELTNFGDTAADLTGFTMDDGSFNVTTSVTLDGITSIAPGESVIFTEGGSTNTNNRVNNFIAAWGTAVSGVQVGYYGGSGVGLGAGGDALTVFDGDGDELPGTFGGLIRVSFGAATKDTSFEWRYDADGDLISPALGQLTTVGSTYQYLDSVSGNLMTVRASPGMVIPEPGSLVLGGLGLLGLLRRRRA